jgi:hypothetical protein
MARQVERRANAVRRTDVVSGAGRYAALGEGGRRLLAHELTHVVRQAGIVQAKEDAGTPKPDAGMPKPKFESVETDAAQAEFLPIVEDYIKKGKDKLEARFLAMDDMFAKRLEKTGGKRIGTRTPIPGRGRDVYLLVREEHEREGRQPIRPGIGEVGVHEEGYNCHSFTFHDAKNSKADTLKTLAKDASELGAPKGTMYYDSSDLDRAEIHIDYGVGSRPLIFPRWIASPAEVARLLANYRRLKSGEPLRSTGSDIVIYSKSGNLDKSDDFPHSAKVTEVDKRGNPTKVKGKWGHYSMFEHDPEAVPQHYGKPYFFRKK